MDEIIQPRIKITIDKFIDVPRYWAYDCFYGDMPKMKRLSINKKMSNMENTEPLVITELKRTCSCCPDQYEGILEDGRMLYIRLRYENLTVQISAEPTKFINRAVWGEYLVDIRFDKSAINRTELKEAFQKEGIKVNWKKCDYIDPYRLPNRWNYSLIGGMGYKFWSYKLTIKRNWRNFKQAIVNSSAPIKRNNVVFRRGFHPGSFYTFPDIWDGTKNQGVPSEPFILTSEA